MCLRMRRRAYLCIWQTNERKILYIQIHTRTKFEAEFKFSFVSEAAVGPGALSSMTYAILCFNFKSDSVRGNFQVKFNVKTGSANFLFVYRQVFRLFEFLCTQIVNETLLSKKKEKKKKYEKNFSPRSECNLGVY